MKKDDDKVKETALKYHIDQGGKRYTYADYVSWDTEDRYELIDGVAYLMSTPLVIHQRILRKLLVRFDIFLEGKKCEVFCAPFGVRLFGRGDDDDTVVQPDILVICNQSKMDEKGGNGAPDLIIEILSPSNPRHDKVRKFNKYLQAGVREYWIVDPESKTVSVHILENGKYVTREYADTDTISVHVLEGCKINMPDVFA